MKNILSRIALAAVIFTAFGAATCQPLIYRDPDAEAPMVMYGNELIYANPSGLYAVNLTNNTQRLVLAGTVDDFDALVVDGSVLFWVDAFRGRVRRYNMANGNLATVAG